MKQSQLHLSLCALLSIANIHAEKADACNVLPHPNDKIWFGSGGEEGHYKKPNDLQNKQRYLEAIKAYGKILEEEAGTDRDQKMALLNQATCQTSQGEAGANWKEFDSLWRKSLPPEKQKELEGKEFPEDHNLLKGKIIRVDEATAGIGDDFHFFNLLEKLKEKGCNVVMVMSKGFLTPVLQGAAEKAGITLVKSDAPEAQEFDYQTHLFALFGHLKIEPQELRPTGIVHYPLKRDDGSDPVSLVTDQVNFILKQDENAHVMFLHIGDATRPAVVPGGKELTKRHINPDAINNALRVFKHLYIIDLGAHKETTKFTPAKDIEHADDRVIAIERDKAFDTLLAAGIVMRQIPEAYLVNADNGEGNVAGINTGGKCPDVVTPAADRSITIVNGEQHDWRVNGDQETSDDYESFYETDQNGDQIKIGDRYRHLVAAGLVYRAISRQSETAIVEQAIRDLIEKGNRK